jgi:hypothetical protein
MTESDSANKGDKKSNKSFRKRLGLSSKKKNDEKRDDKSATVIPDVSDGQGATSMSGSNHSIGAGVGAGSPTLPAADSGSSSLVDDQSSSQRSIGSRQSSRSGRTRPSDISVEGGNNNNDPHSPSEMSSSKPRRSGRTLAEGVMRRVRSLSRSRSSRGGGRGSDGGGGDTDSSSDSEHGGRRNPKRTVVTVTSCRSDGYYNQKAPGSTSKLPRKAPTNLKLFHELAVGLKDAYAAVGETPTKPVMVDEETGEMTMSEEEFQGRNVLWEFIGNVDFVSQ